MTLSNEKKVGALVVGTILLALGFGWLIGVQNPFQSTLNFYVTYNFAGGIELGSPVRVSGIKVGRVDKIEFFTPADPQLVALQEPGSADDLPGDAEIIPIRLKISVQRDAARGIKKDSRFYINLAGVIGERYIEITPGSMKAEPILAGDVVAGIDPPRIDQLLSQSFDLAGKIADIIEKNKGDITRSIELLYKLSNNLNKTIKSIDKSKVFKTDIGLLIENLIAITGDMRQVTDKVSTPEGKKTLDLMYRLLWRLEPLEPEAIRKFLQQEGIRARIF